MLAKSRHMSRCRSSLADPEKNAAGLKKEDNMAEKRNILTS